MTATEDPSLNQPSGPSCPSGHGMARMLFERLYALTQQQVGQLEQTTVEARNNGQADEKHIKMLALLTRQLDHILALEKRVLELDHQLLPGEDREEFDEACSLAEQQRAELAQRLESLHTHADQEICAGVEGCGSRQPVAGLANLGTG